MSDEHKDTKTIRREVVLINDSKQKGSGLWDRTEQIAKILALIAIPALIAIGGWIIQHSISLQSVNKDYVQLAVSILTKSDEEVAPSLRNWAVELLNDKSTVKFSPEVATELATGQLKLPTTVFARGGVPFKPKFIKDLFSEWNKATELSQEFRAILIELADDILKHKWQKVATFFDPTYYNEQLSLLGSGRLDREGIINVMRQFIHEAMSLGIQTTGDSIYSIDLDRIVKIRYLDIIESSNSKTAIIQFRLIQDDKKEITSGYEFDKTTYFFLGAYG
jgi:hypothetical protein